MSETENAAGPGGVLAAPTPGLARPQIHLPETVAHRFPDRAARHWLLSSVVWLTIVVVLLLRKSPDTEGFTVRKVRS